MASDSLKKLKREIEKIKPQLVEAGIDMVKWLTLAELYDESTCSSLLAKLEVFGVPGSAFAEFNKIYAGQPVSWWQHIKALGETDLPEQRLLKTRAVPLRKAWKELNGKAKPDSVKGTPEAVSV